MSVMLFNFWDIKPVVLLGCPCLDSLEVSIIIADVSRPIRAVRYVNSIQVQFNTPRVKQHSNVFVLQHDTVNFHI